MGIQLNVSVVGLPIWAVSDSHSDTSSPALATGAAEIAMFLEAVDTLGFAHVRLLLTEMEIVACVLNVSSKITGASFSRAVPFKVQL